MFRHTIQSTPDMTVQPATCFGSFWQFHIISVHFFLTGVETVGFVDWSSFSSTVQANGSQYKFVKTKKVDHLNIFTSDWVLTWLSVLIRLWRRVSKWESSSAAMISAPKGRAWALTFELLFPFPLWGYKLWCAQCLIIICLRLVAALPQTFKCASCTL